VGFFLFVLQMRDKIRIYGCFTLIYDTHRYKNLLSKTKLVFGFFFGYISSEYSKEMSLSPVARKVTFPYKMTILVYTF